MVLHTYGGTSALNYVLVNWNTTAEAGTAVYFEIEDYTTEWCAWTPPIVIFP